MIFPVRWNLTVLWACFISRYGELVVSTSDSVMYLVINLDSDSVVITCHNDVRVSEWLVFVLLSNVIRPMRPLKLSLYEITNTMYLIHISAHTAQHSRVCIRTPVQRHILTDCPWCLLIVWSRWYDVVVIVLWRTSSLSRCGWFFACCYLDSFLNVKKVKGGIIALWEDHLRAAERHLP